MIIRTLIFMTILLPTISVAENSFDEICKIYTEAINSSLTKEDLNNYIFKNVKNRINSKDALEAHSAVFNLGTDKRFKIFKESAEYSLKRKWECTAIKTLMR